VAQLFSLGIIERYDKTDTFILAGGSFFKLRCCRGFDLAFADKDGHRDYYSSSSTNY